MNRHRYAGVPLLAAALLAGRAGAQYQTMQLAGPAQGLSNPDRNIFPSHNQHVVENANGIFCTLNGTKMDRSTDGGLTFVNVYDLNNNVDDYRAPNLETDEDNNLYLIYPEPDQNRTRFQKFTSANGYTAPTISTAHTQADSAGKFASVYDQPRQVLYHATQGGYLFTFNKSGGFVRGKQIWTTGSTGASPQYPHLFLDDGGVLHFGQTTALTGRYDSIRYLKSTDGGQNWKKMDGTAVTTPVSCDADSGNSTQINLEDEEGDGKNTWLANMHVKNGKVHFQYRARGVSPERQHYMRFAADTGVREIDSWSDFAGGAWKGETLTFNSLYGCFASDPTNPNGPLFAVSAVSADRAGALVSYDNGSTWEDCARSADVDKVEDFGSSRFSPKYGRVIGMFTSALAPYGWATPVFFKFTTYKAVTWDSTSSIGWGTAGSWLGDVVPTFNNAVDVHFYADGATSLDNNLGPSDRTVRSLNFNGNADSSLTIYLSSDNTDSGTARTLTLSSDGNGAAGANAAINVRSGASGSFSIGSGLGAITLADNLLVTHDGSGGLFINRPINETGGAKSLTKGGGGEMALAGANTFTGGIIINDGKLAFNSTVSENNVPDVSVAASATLSLGAPFVGGTATIGDLTGAGTVDPVYGSTVGTRTLQVSQTADGSFSGTIADGSGSRVLALIKTGAARLTLSGTANTYSGGTTIGAGTLRISADGSLGASAGDITFTSGGSGILMNNDSVVALNSGRQVNLTGAGSFQCGWAKDMTIAAKITGAGGLTVKSDATPGRVVLSNSGNDYSGGTTIESSSNLALANGANRLPSGGDLVCNGALDMNGYAQSVGDLTGSGAIVTDGGALNVTVAANDTYSGTISGAGTLTVNGNDANWLFLSGSSSYTGGTTINDNGGIAAVNNNALGTGGNVTVASGGSLAIGAGITIGRAISMAGTGLGGTQGALKAYQTGTATLSGTVTMTGDAMVNCAASGQNLTIAPALSGSSTRILTKDGAGTLTITGASSFKEIVMSGGGTLAGGKLTLSNAGIYGVRNTDGNNTISSAIELGSQNTATDNLDFSCDAGTLTLNGVVSSASGYGMDVWPSTSTIVFRNANTYPGLTQVYGTLRLGIANGIKSGNDVWLNSTGILDLNGQAQTLDALTGAGSVLTGGGALIVGSGGSSFAFGGVISGGGSLIKTGAGTAALGGANTYTGPTAISNGTLLVHGSLATGAVTVAAAGTLGGTGTIGGGVTSAGVVAPGASAGRLTLARSYTQNAGGSLRLEIGGLAAGAQYDQLVVSNTATLGGNLTVTLLNGFVPVAGNSFTVLRAGSLGGTAFATTNLPPIGSNQWVVSYPGNTAVVLSVSGPPLTGYDLWASAITNGLTNYSDCATGDGYPNLLKYASGSSPTQADDLARLNFGTTGGLFAARFNRDLAATDVTIVVEGAHRAGDGAAWQGVATNLHGSWGAATNWSENAATNLARAMVWETAAATSRFLRLRVTRP